MKAAIACILSVTALVPAVAEAQSGSPRIVMRRPLNPSSTTGVTAPACGVEGQPACPTNCEFVGAMWEVGQWTGDACGSGGTVTRSVRCMAIKSTGERVTKDDSFCLQDQTAFRASCNSPVLQQ